MRRMMLLLAGLALVASACGAPVESGNLADETKNPAPSTPAPSPKVFPTHSGKCAAKGTANKGKKPTITIPANCPQPTRLETVTLIKGSGPRVALGNTITVHYVGVGWQSKKEFDSSWKGGQPAEFQLQEGGLIKGWTDAIPGMQVGERRLLAIPGALAYGANPPQGAAIAPNEALVFVVDVVKIS